MALNPQLLATLTATVDTLRTKVLSFEANDNPYLAEMYFDHTINEAGTTVELRLRLKYQHKDSTGISTSLETSLKSGLDNSVTFTHIAVTHDAALNAATTEVNARYLVELEEGG